jgi:hypothetical protein
MALGVGSRKKSGAQHRDQIPARYLEFMERIPLKNVCYTFAYGTDALYGVNDCCREFEMNRSSFYARRQRQGKARQGES